VGENGTIRVSTDGIQWRAANSGATAWLNEVTTLGDTWYVVGTAGTVLSSTNLTDWTRLGTITPKSLFGAASLNGQLIVAGVEGVVLRAQVIPDLTPVKFLDFKQAGGYNVFMVGGKTGQRFTFDASPDLAQWTTGPVLEIFDHAGTFIFSQGVDPARPAMFYRATLAP
jgi:hypothetical protein